MVKFSVVANQNPWWKFGDDFSRFDKDLVALQNQIIPIEREWVDLEQGDIGVIRGCRQIGKTTYMKTYVKRLMEDGVEPRSILYLSVDRFIATRRELRRAISSFLKRNRDAEEVFIILDEVTVLKDWTLELKSLSDSGVTKRSKVLVTGSSGEALRRTGEQLPGRGLEGNEYYMKPLTFREFVFQTIPRFEAKTSSGELQRALRLLEGELKKVKITLQENLSDIHVLIDPILPFESELEYLFEHYLRCGGFPMAINQYVENVLYLKKDGFFEPGLNETFVRIVLGELSKAGKNETMASRILKEIIDRQGSRYSFTRLANALSMNHVTTGDYIDFLERSFILTVLYAYDFSKKDIKYKGGKKVYFQDPFILYSLKSSLTGKGINETIRETLEDEELASEIVEGMVLSHLLMSKETPYLKEKNSFLWFYYDTRGKEIDAVLNRDGDYLGIEVKYQNDVGPGDVTRIHDINNYIILSKDDLIETEDTYVVPIEVLLSTLETSRHNL